MGHSSELLLSLRGWTLERQTATGSRPILRDIDLDLHAGRWLAVVGANGSGKSSLLKYLAADDSPLAEQAAIMFQDPDEQIFATGVDREIVLGRPGRDPAAVRAEFGLRGTGELNPRLLSAGQKQRLALAVALGDEPRVLLCDEPTSLQDVTQADWVLDRLDHWRRTTGGALVTATCDRREAVRSDEMIVLDGGRIVSRGPTGELLREPLVRSLLGDGETAPERSLTVPGGETPVLELQAVGCQFPTGDGLMGVDLTVRPGEHVGLVGENGSGKSTLLAVCAGARRPDAGSVRLLGRRLYSGRGPDLDHGAALLAPQFPEYLFTRSTVAAELAVDPRLAAEFAPAEFLAALELDVGLAKRNPHDLSSGQRRRLALGLVLLSGRPVLLLDEPTAALDRAGRARVLEMLAVLPAETALVVASHDRDFLAAAGCRLQPVQAGSGPD